MIKGNPKVSIVIPVYNGANYLHEAIDSALAQTYHNIEVIVVNDGSNDAGKTEAIAKSYGDRIRYFYKENGGVSSALNLGIREMTGEYFSWLSHDDVYYLEKINKQINCLKYYRGFQITFCNTEIIDHKGIVSSNRNPKKVNDVFGASSFWDTWIYACAMLIHIDCIYEVGLLNEDNLTTQDTEFTLRLLSKFHFFHLPEILVRRRKHEESGYYINSELNIKENKTLYFRLLDNYGINFFYPNIDKENNLSLAKAYGMLGDIFLKQRNTWHTDFIRFCYIESVRYNQSLFNLYKYKSFIGAYNIQRVFGFTGKVKVVGLMKLRNSFNKIKSPFLKKLIKRSLNIVRKVKNTKMTLY